MGLPCHAIRCASFLLVGLLSCATLAPAADTSATEAGLPPAVAKTFRSRFPRVKVTKLEAEKENGVKVYDFEFTNRAVDMEADIAADGTLLEITVVVGPGAVPPAAMDAIREATADGTIKRIERVHVDYETKDGKAVKLAAPMTKYAVEIARGDRMAEIMVAPDGMVIEPARWDADDQRHSARVRELAPDHHLDVAAGAERAEARE